MTAPTAGRQRVLVVGADDELAGLLQAWLAALDCEVVAEADAPAGAPGRFDAAIIDIPFPRQEGRDLVQRIAQRHPGTPIVALSAMFFACVECFGQVSRALGVSCALPKPVSREALLDAVGRVLAR